MSTAAIGKGGADDRQWIILAWLVLLAPALRAQENADWTTPIAPFRIAGNLYYVGGKDLASYLIVTPQGDILINSNLEGSVDVWIDPRGYQAAVAERQQAFEQELNRQEKEQ
jgi:hypothetical protein